MTKNLPWTLSLFVLSMCLGAVTQTPAVASGNGIRQETQATMHAKGTFDVKIAPLPSDNMPKSLARMSINKQFHGDLDGSSVGEMLTAATEMKGSAGYVAEEQVTGTLNGRKGSFILQHSATMDRGTPHLSIRVVPDSGTGDLVGITGSMNIIIDQGKHSYDFEYHLPQDQK